MQEKTAFGIWISRYALEHCVTMADIAHELEISPSLLSFIIHGKRAIPGDLRYKITRKFELCGDKLSEMENALRATYEKGGTIGRESIPYVVCKAVNKHPWTRDILKLFCSCVNKLNEDEIMKYKTEFQAVAERPNKY